MGRDDECISNKCSQGTCLAHNSCEVLGGYDGPFDQKTVVMVFIGSGFTDLNQFEEIADKNFKNMIRVDMFKDPAAKYKALYVRELAPAFCDYFCEGVERLLCCEQATAEILTDKCFPKKPELQTVVIHNDIKYGGAGYINGNMAVISTNPFATHLLVHELGHSLFNFADEYAGSEATDKDSPNCDVAGCPKVRQSKTNVNL